MKASGKALVGLLVLPVVLVFACLYAQREVDKPRFYVDDDLESDVWQIPIIEPHRLITADGGNNKTQAGYSRWNFQKQNLATLFNPDSINYQQGFITFHDIRNKYGFYDLSQDKTTFLDSYQQFKSFTQAKAIERVLYHTEAVYGCWQQTRQLPWAKEIFVQNYGSTTSN